MSSDGLITIYVI